MPAEVIRKVIDGGLSLMSQEGRREILSDLADGDTDKLARFIDNMTAAVGVSINELNIPKLDDLLSSINGAEAAADPEVKEYIKQLEKETLA